MRLWITVGVALLVGCYPLDSTWDPLSPSYLTPGRVVFDPGAGLDFGTLEQNQALTLPVTVTNPGKRDLRIDAVQIQGGGFSTSSPSLPVVLGPDGQLALAVAIDSTTTGVFGAELAVQTARGDYRLGLRGEVVPPGSTNPSLAILQGKNGQFAHYQSGDTLDFGGDRSTDLNSWEVPFVVSNVGDLTATNVNVALSGPDFVFVQTFSNLTLHPGASSPEFRVRFPAGTSSGHKSATLTVTSSNHPSVTLNLAGEVLPSVPLFNLVDRNHGQTFAHHSRPIPLPTSYRDFLFVNSGYGGMTVISLTSLNGKIQFVFSPPHSLNTGEKVILQIRKDPMATSGSDELQVTTSIGVFNYQFEAP